MTSHESFDGEIGLTVADSTPSWPVRPHPADGAPNVVVILLDDVGLARLGCYGSTMTTPNIDRLAADGLRYTNFHVTPLCSPTRAAMLTGRNHHEVGMRSLSNFSTGFPNMRGNISNHSATIAEVLRGEGYATFAIGSGTCARWRTRRRPVPMTSGPWPGVLTGIMAFSMARRINSIPS